MCLIVFCNAVFSQSTSKICTLIRFTLFSNSEVDRAREPIVLLPYRFTLFSNERRSNFTIAFVLLPYRFTLFSNFHPVFGNCQMFYYLIDLHYSQTRKCFRLDKLWFYYLIDLHYSQTYIRDAENCDGFTTL